MQSKLQGLTKYVMFCKLELFEKISIIANTIHRKISFVPPIELQESWAANYEEMKLTSYMTIPYLSSDLWKDFSNSRKG